MTTPPQDDLTAERAAEKQCNVKGCTRMGVPQEGYDFFICDPCFVHFEKCLERAYMRKIIQNN